MGDVAVDLPTIDLYTFWYPNSPPNPERLCAATQLARACEKYGIFYIRCPASATCVTEPAFRAARALFSLPLTVKKAAVPNVPVLSAARGYLEVGAESGGNTFERKEGFSYAIDMDSDGGNNIVRNALQAPNIWPKQGQLCSEPEIRPAFEAFLVQMGQAAVAVTRAMAIALKDDALVNVCEGGLPVSLMRCFHYLPIGPESAETSETGSSEHTDWSLCTIIAVEEGDNSKPALEALIEDRWRSVSPKAGTFVVNCGDFMALRSQGRFQSPLHRVKLTQHERISFVYFQYPHHDTPVPPLQEIHVAQTLSLLQDQSKSDPSSNPTCGACAGEAGSYGDLIAEKWKQVARTLAEKPA